MKVELFFSQFALPEAPSEGVFTFYTDFNHSP